MQLRSFTRWLCAGTETANSVSPQLSEYAYLPVCEDNNVLTTHFGRIFDSVLSIEIVHFYMALHNLDFVTSPKSYFKGPPIGEERIYHVATVVLYCFYRIALWSAQVHPSNKGVDIVCSFPAFVRLAMSVLTADVQWRSKLPPEMHCVAGVFKDMRTVFNTGSFKGTKVFDLVQGKCWMNKCVISEERFLTGLLQIAFVLSELPKGNENKYILDQATWDYTPLRLLSSIEVQRMAMHSTQEVESGNKEGVLIERCNASFMHLMTVSGRNKRIEK